MNTEQIGKKTLPELYKLWDALADVPVLVRAGGEAVLDEPFLDFQTGTNVENVWHWFEAQNPTFICGDVMQGKRP